MSPKPKRERSSLNLNQFFAPPVGGEALDFLLGAPEETAQRAQSRGLPLRDLPVRAIAPDREQVRRLPRPDDLLQMEAAGDRVVSALLAPLRELGASLREHGQLQPAIVYPDTDPEDAVITHRLLHGQRRWTAAILANLPTLWVVEVERPSDVHRLLRQFEENERRTGLGDMERAWALVSLHEALQRETGSTIPWAVVEARLQISEGRRHDLLRRLRFSPEGQALILRYGWAAWTLRPLHQALSAGTVDAGTVTDLLHTLANQAEVTATVVAALVATYVQAQQPSALGCADNDGNAQGNGESGAATAVPGAASKVAPDTISQHFIRLRRNLEQLQVPVPREANAARRAT